jgi:phosphoserine phosphatase
VKLVLLDMDGTVLMGRSLSALAHAFGLEEKLRQLDAEKERLGLSEREVAARIAQLFSGRPLRELKRIVDFIPFTPGAVWWVKRLRQAGAQVALVSDSWRPLVGRVARRLGVDLVWANDLETELGLVTGRILPPPCPKRLPEGCRKHAVCKLYALESLSQRLGIPREHTLAVGDGTVDVCMLREAGLGVALNPKSPEVAQAADLVVYGDFYDLEQAVKEASRGQSAGFGVV